MTPCPAPACAGWGRARAKADAPSHSAPHLPAYGPALSLPTAAPLPAYGRITVRKGGVHKANPAPARAYSPRRLVYGRAPGAYDRITVRKGGVHKAIPAPARAFFPRQPAYARALAR